MMRLTRKCRRVFLICLLCSLAAVCIKLFNDGIEYIAIVDNESIDVQGSSFLSASKNIERPMFGGCRANYSILEVNDLVNTFQTRFKNDSMYVITFEQPYKTFLKEMNSLKKKGIMLRKQKDKNLYKSTAERFQKGINQYYLYDPNDEQLIQDLLRDLNTLPIISAETPQGGSQLKIRLKYADGSTGYFKPMRLPREVDTDPDSFFFQDIERHTAEIAGFHLDRILGFNKVMPVVGRMLNVTADLAQYVLNTTFVSFYYTSPAGNHCFVATCLYLCGTSFPFCAHGVLLEGSIAAALPNGRDLLTHPYKRRYIFNGKAAWETDEAFCDKQVKNSTSVFRILEFTDIAVFDFLIGNLDRHEYEMFRDLGTDSFIAVFDNGRGFGKSHYDCMSCLAPLRQCCLIRLSTLTKLIKLYQGPDSLSHLMRTSLSSDPISPILLEPHLDALDRRLVKVIKVVNDCISARSWNDVVINDISA